MERRPGVWNLAQPMAARRAEFCWLTMQAMPLRRCRMSSSPLAHPISSGAQPYRARLALGPVRRGALQRAEGAGALHVHERTWCLFASEGRKHCASS